MTKHKIAFTTPAITDTSTIEAELASSTTSWTFTSAAAAAR